MHRDINDLQNKIVTKDELQEMEAKLEEKMDGLKEEIMEVLKNFVTEKTPESENASHEIHDEEHKEGESRMEKLQLWVEDQPRS
jgi:gas vesicle protein